jgi:3-oxosteroid 1-dehydrogenase
MVNAAGLRFVNKACAEGADQDFGRGGNVYNRYGGDPEAWPAPNLGPLTEPPFYAARVLAGTMHDDGLHRGPPRRREPGITAPY